LGLGSGLGSGLGLGTWLGTRPVGLGPGLGQPVVIQSAPPVFIERDPLPVNPRRRSRSRLRRRRNRVVVLLPGCERVLPVREGMPGRLAARVAAAALVMG